MPENQFRFGTGEQLYYTLGETSAAFRVRPRSVRNWIRKKWLTPHFRLLGGRIQTVFSTRELMNFADWYLPTQASLDAPGERGSHRDKINRIRARARGSAIRASQASMKKRLADVYGIQTEQDEDDPETNDQGPATLDRRSARRWNMQPERPSDLDRSFTEERWEDDEEGKG